MKTIGLIGGMSWESSIEYYRIINEVTKSKLGGLHSAKSVMYSVDFAEIEALQHQSRWQEAAALMISAAQSLERAGADFVVLCTNTMHKLADEIEASLSNVNYIGFFPAFGEVVSKCDKQVEMISLEAGIHVVSTSDRDRLHQICVRAKTMWYSTNPDPSDPYDTSKARSLPDQDRWWNKVN